jgi:hypothetical protein
MSEAKIVEAERRKQPENRAREEASVLIISISTKTMVELFPAVGNKNLSTPTVIFGRPQPGQSVPEPVSNWLLAVPLRIHKMPGNDKRGKREVARTKCRFNGILAPRQGLLAAWREIDAFEFSAFFRTRRRITLGHQNGIGETKSGKAKEGHNDEENLAEGERLDAD